MHTTPVLVVTALLAATLTACGSSANDTVARGSCPTAPVKVVASIDQWGDIVSALGGDCADVTTVITSSAADPHDYEPTAGDLAAFDRADLVVVNGLDYDAWATRAADIAGAKATRVNIADLVGVQDGANPHLWYSPGFVTEAADAITAKLKTLEPTAATYFDAQAKSWNLAMKPYVGTIADIAALHPHATYAATETVFDYMAQAIGLNDVTPAGFRNASANESEPAPGDVAAFDKTLRAKDASVLLYNTQTEGSVPEQLRRIAEAAGVPVVEVTESVPPGVDSFLAWQIAQLTALKKALAGS